jgi:hypothetical protein
LVLRAVVEDRTKTEQVRRYMRHGFGKAAHQHPWESTNRSTGELVKLSIAEVRESITANQPLEEPGPASLELAVRAAYPLIVSGRLNADRGTAGNDQPDRRTPGEVLDAMRRTLHGVYQLGQALEDFSASRPIRAVNEEGQIRALDDESGEMAVNDIYLRSEFPPPGKAKALRSEDTPSDRYHNRVSVFSKAMDDLSAAFRQVSEVLGDDGQPLVDSRGVDLGSCTAWRTVLGQIDEELVVWGRTFRRAHGSKANASFSQNVGTGDSESDDDDADDAVDAWDRLATGTDDSLSA